MQKPIYVTEQKVEIFVERGRKSLYDFKVRYKEPGKSKRTPKHIHLIIDLYLKKAGNRHLTLRLVRKFLENLLTLKPARKFPPEFQIFRKENFQEFSQLNLSGEYSVEFLAAIFELIMIQEKTNYPKGVINRKLFEAFLSEKDIFSVVSAATFRGAA